MLPEISTLLREELPPSSAAWPSWRTSTTTRPSSRACRRRAFSPARPSFETSYEIMPTIPFDELDVPSSTRWARTSADRGWTRTSSVGWCSIRRARARTARRQTHLRPVAHRPLASGTRPGLAPRDLIHADLLEEMDISKSLINTITAKHRFRGPAVPAPVETDRAGFVASLSTVGVVSPEEARVARVTDTMRPRGAVRPEALVEEAREREGPGGGPGSPNRSSSWTELSCSVAGGPGSLNDRRDEISAGTVGRHDSMKFPTQSLPIAYLLIMVALLKSH